jgi:RNA polymerase sigma-70 factor (family 1)
LKAAHEFSDYACLLELRANKSEAFDVLFHLFAPGLYRFANSHLKSSADAEEIVQDCFMKLWEKRYELTDGVVFKTYLYTSAYHAILNQVRRQQYWVFEDCNEQMLIEESGLSSQVEYHELEQLYDEALAQLPPRRREIFMLSRQQGLSYAHIARELDISVKSVETQMTLALKFLRLYFRAHGMSLALLLALYSALGQA